MTRTISCKVLVTPSKDLPGVWVAHCIDLDVVSQGDSISHAFWMAADAIRLVVRDALRRGVDAHTERGTPPGEPYAPALAAAYETYAKVCRSGARLDFAPDPEHIGAVAGIVQLFVVDGQLHEHAKMLVDQFRYATR